MVREPCWKHLPREKVKKHLNLTDVSGGGSLRPQAFPLLKSSAPQLSTRTLFPPKINTNSLLPLNQSALQRCGARSPLPFVFPSSEIHPVIPSELQVCPTSPLLPTCPPAHVSPVCRSWRNVDSIQPAQTENSQIGPPCAIPKYGQRHLS